MQEFKDVKEKIEGLKPQLERLKRSIATTTIDGDPEETGRRAELTRSDCQSISPSALPNDLRSVLEEIEKRSQELMAKGTATRFVDKAGDSGEVAKLVEQLREGIAHYQVGENCFYIERDSCGRTAITTAIDL